MSEETRQRILEAAAAEFGEKGFAGATTKAIAARAGVNEVTLFRHFGKKQELMQAVLDHAKAGPDLLGRLFQEAEGQPPREMLLALARGQMAFLAPRSATFRLRLLEQSPDRQASGGMYGFRVHLARYLALWQQRGTLRGDVDPMVAAEAYANAVLGFAISREIFGSVAGGPEPEAYLIGMVDLFLRGMEVR